MSVHDMADYIWQALVGGVAEAEVRVRGGGERGAGGVLCACGDRP